MSFNFNPRIFELADDIVFECNICKKILTISRKYIEIDEYEGEMHGDDGPEIVHL